MISFNQKTQTIHHGGNLDFAIKRYNIPKEQWIDLSTGISPWAYPITDLPDNVWQELPPSNNELITIAATYYGVNPGSITATPGSQLAIRLIPQLFEPANVAIPSLGYKEHAISWQTANHQTINYNNTTELIELISNKLVQHVVLINPNNPSGEKIDLDTLKKIIPQVDGACIIDEAFVDFYDTDEINSATKLLCQNESDNLIILRSVGKFFGLAGIRLGFAIGSHPELLTLRALLDPWSISHVSQTIGIQALQDSPWQQQQRNKIKQQQDAFQIVLDDLLNSHLKHFSMTETGLFNSVFAEKSKLKELHHQLAKQAIWTRLGNKNDQPSWLRFGLTKDIAEFEKRTHSLSHAT